MISDGKLSKEISWLLSISVHTVTTHQQRILEKFGPNNSIEAFRNARHKGLIG
jgi:DNA-binding CsgD family transcriptional regulator